MKRVKIGIFLVFAFLFLAFGVFAAQINSTSYRQTVIVSAGGENISSATYKTNIAIGIISRIINSTSYINKLGFFHTLLLANDQPCTSAGQCEGGFCCSSLCKSSSCPSGEAAAAGGGGAAAPAGGGGGGIVTPLAEEIKKEFSVSPSSIKEHLALDTAKTKTIAIKNTGNSALDFELNVATINGFVFLSDSSFKLEPGQEKDVEANIIGKKLGSYIGEIEISAGGIKKSVTVIVEVVSEKALFDVKIDIPSAYTEVEAGKYLKAQITLLNVGPPRKVDVTTNYIIKDRQGNIVYETSETFAVEKQTSFVKSFKIPENLAAGDYLAIIEVRYEDSFAVSSELFRVVPREAAAEKAFKSNMAFVSAFVVFIGLVFLFVYTLMPKVMVSERKKIKRFQNTLNSAKDAAENDITKARKLYAEARNLYFSLGNKQKKEVYGNLMELYNRLK